MWMPTDCGGIEEDGCAAQGSQARSLGIPLVPADQRAYPSHGRIECPKAEIPRGEVKLLVIRRIIGDVHLAVSTKRSSVRVNYYGAVVINPRCAALENRSNHGDAILPGCAFHRVRGRARNTFSEIK